MATRNILIHLWHILKYFTDLNQCLNPYEKLQNEISSDGSLSIIVNRGVFRHGYDQKMQYALSPILFAGGTKQR